MKALQQAVSQWQRVKYLSSFGVTYYDTEQRAASHNIQPREPASLACVGILCIYLFDTFLDV